MCIFTFICAKHLTWILMVWFMHVVCYCTYVHFYIHLAMNPTCMRIYVRFFANISYITQEHENTMVSLVYVFLQYCNALFVYIVHCKTSNMDSHGLVGQHIVDCTYTYVHFYIHLSKTSSVDSHGLVQAYCMLLHICAFLH